MTAARWRQAMLLLALVAAAVGYLFEVHDTPLLVLLVGALGLPWSSRGGAALPLAGVMIAGGLFWSSQDASHCSAWWRGKIVAAKMTGDLPHVPWNDIRRVTLSDCYGFWRPHPRIAAGVVKIDEKRLGNHHLELFETDLGRFWIAAPGRDVLTFLLWEMTFQRDYDGGGVRIQPGDTVIDCGAHVGVFTRYALRQGAGQVVAIEPEPGNIASLEANFAEEIASGKVTLVKAGVWDKKTRLPLGRTPNSATFTFVDVPEAARGEELLVLRLDEIVEQLQLESVDFVKMDIEGAERRALSGAAGVLREFKPRMAICSYHQPGDADVIPQIVRQARPDYQFQGKDVAVRGSRVATKVLFFR